MQFISLDIETTGLNPLIGQVIQFGAIIEDTDKKLSYEEIPKFEFLLEHSMYSSDRTFALHMHQALFKRLADADLLNKEQKRDKGIISIDELSESFSLWLNINGINPLKDPVNIAGKNAASFDIPWCQQTIPHWNKFIKTSQRILDPAILFTDITKDKRLPNMEECKRRAGFVNTTIAHTTLLDAWDVILLLRQSLGKRVTLDFK